MSFKPCPSANEGCRFYETELGCVTNTHHRYWPKRRYTTSVERAFRELPDNKVDLCMDEHRELHATEAPPHKPTRNEMLQALANIAIQEVA